MSDDLEEKRRDEILKRMLQTPPQPKALKEAAGPAKRVEGKREKKKPPQPETN